MQFPELSGKNESNFIPQLFFMLKAPYLRVSSPKTINGVIPVIGDDGRVAFREDHLPLTAKKALESQNAFLPESLRKKIEVVHDGIEPNSDQFGPDQPKTRNKPGPKPKNA